MSYKTKPKKSWKTTLCGIFSAVSFIVTEPNIANALLQSSDPKIQTIGHILCAMGIAFGFYFSKDKSVED